MKKIVLGMAFILVALAVPAMAQESVVTIGTVSTGGMFLAVIVGVLLALTFQLMFVLLSTASGMSAMGNLEEKIFARPRSHTIGSGSEPLEKLKKTIHAMGAWTLVTGSLSIFLATWLAVKISLLASPAMNAVIGLAIWAAFVCTVTFLEMRMARSLFGQMIHLAGYSISSAGRAVKTIAGHSRQHQKEKTIQKTLTMMRHEVSEMLHDRHITDKLDDYVRRLQPPELDLRKARKELAKLLDEIEVREKLVDGEGGVEKRIFLEVAERHSKLSKEDVKHLGEVFDEVKEARKEGKDKGDQVLKAIDKLAPGSEEETHELRQRIADYFEKTETEALSPEALKQDLNQIINNPKTTRTVFQNRIKQFDHPTLVNIVEKTKHCSHDDAERIVQKVEMALSSIKENVLHSGERETGNGQSQMARQKEKVKMRLARYFDDLDRPEISSEELARDMDRIFHDPKETPEVLKERLNRMDRETAVAVLSSNPRVSREQAERIVDRVIARKDELISKKEAIEQVVREKMEDTKRFAAHEAELVRECAGTAAWWSFVTVVITAGFAVLGGYLGV